MAEVTWFKVLTDIFADDKIKIIQSMPEGDSLLVMWFKVLSQAGRTNDGGYIYLRKNIPYTPSMLATLFNKPQMIVELALKTFSQFEMIDIDENGYLFVTNWEKHQNIEGMDKVREQNRLRNKQYRDKKRLELMSGDVTANVTHDVTRRLNDATELELELELDKEKIKKSSSGSSMIGNNPFSIYEKQGFGKIDETTAIFVGDAIDSYGEDWTRRAMTEAVKHGKKVWSYVEGILKRWKATGHAEPWTLEREEPKQQQRSGGYGGKPQRPRMEVVKDDGPEVTPEQMEEMMKLARELQGA
jgi:predicted phage replisome organizer